MRQSWFVASNLSSRRKRRSLFTRVIFVVGVLCCSQIFRSFSPNLSYLNEGESSYFTRHLLSTSKWETCDFETDYLRNKSSSADREITPNSAYGWLALHVGCVIIIFIALAIICDDFFVPSLEAISEKLDLSEDVAGATFMAAGSSAPELFTSVAGVTADSDVGVGTIVGSAVFNMLVIIALTAALTTETLQLDWRPLMRDSVCYALSISVFIAFAWDAKFELYESVILLTLYFLYILLMKFNVRLMDFLGRWGQKVSRVSPEVQELPKVETIVELAQENEKKECGPPQGKLPPLQPLEVVIEGDAKSDHSMTVGHGHLPHFTHSHKGGLSKSFRRPSVARNKKLDLVAQLPVTTNSEPLLTSLFENNLNDDDEKTRRKSAVLPHEMVKVKSIAAGHIAREMRRHSAHVGNGKGGEDGLETSSANENREEDESKITVIPCLPALSASTPKLGEGGGLVAYIRLIVDWFLFVISFPFLCMFTWTIPNCSKPHNRKYFLVSFFASIIWIALLSFVMVTIVGRAGCILNIDKFTMGLVVVAIGTSIPDALSSIIVARDGYGDMAVSNAIGSNVFDIDLGIGLPFVLKSLIDNMNPIRLLSEKDQAAYDDGKMIVVPHAKFGFILLFILFLCIGVFSAVKFRLGRVVGISFFLMYVIFVTYAYLQDLLCNSDC